MAGPALAEVLLGKRSPSGKLPVTFPKTPGQIPIYYAHKNTGRPPTEESFVPIAEIPVRSFQTSLGNTSHYLDVGFEPLYPFGFGLSYTTFQYSDIAINTREMSQEDTLHISVSLSNTGHFDAAEVVQLYVRDKVASITRPVKELQAFRRVFLKAGSSIIVEFDLAASRLGYYDEEGQYILEAGEHQLWVGGSSQAKLTEEFKIIE
jgi:beta-glucosidase